MEDLKLYLIQYTVQKYMIQADGSRGMYNPHRGVSLRVARNSKEAVDSFNRHIAPQLKSALERNLYAILAEIPISIDSTRKVDSVQRRKISID